MRATLGAAGAGKEADLDLGQAEPRLWVIGGDAAVTGERELESAAHRGAVERRHPGFAGGFELSVEQRELAAFLEQLRGRRLLSLRAHHVGESLAHAFQHGEVSAAGEGVLGRGDDRALDGGVRRHLVDDRAQLLDHFEIDDVHRAAGHIPDDERDAVGVDVELEVGVGHETLPISCIRLSCPGRSAARSGALQTRDRYKHCPSLRSRISGAPLRAAPYPGHALHPFHDGRRAHAGADA
jgi:hypothetical protein